MGAPLEMGGLTLTPRAGATSPGEFGVDLTTTLTESPSGRPMELTASVVLSNLEEFRDQLRSISLPGRAVLHDYDGEGFSLTVETDLHGGATITTKLAHVGVSESVAVVTRRMTDQSYLPAAADRLSEWLRGSD